MLIKLASNVASYPFEPSHHHWAALSLTNNGDQKLKLIVRLNPREFPYFIIPENGGQVRVRKNTSDA